MSASNNTSIPDDYKCCSKCGTSFPATAEYFHRNKSRKNGLCERCKQCVTKYSKSYYEEHREIVKQKSHEWYLNNLERAKNNHRKYAKEHPDQFRATSRRSYKNHHDRILERGRLYRQANPDIIRATVKRHYDKHPEMRKRRNERQRAYQQANPGKNKAKLAKYRQEHPEKLTEWNLRRRARKAGLPDTYSFRDWQRALDYFNGVCAVCGRPRGFWHTLAADHWIPLADTKHCPGTVPTNIVPLCHGVDGCNNSKSNSAPRAWLMSRFGARKAKQILKRIEAYFAWVKEQDER